jgi:hypothetical protein
LPTTKLQSKGGSISTPTNNAGLIANASASFVVDHGNDYGIYTGYVNSTNDAVGIAATRTLGGVLPLSLQPFGGNVGIGTSSPMVALNVHDSTNARIALTNSSTGQTFPDGFELLATGLDAYVQNRSNGNMIFTTNNTERMRLDSSGNLLVGGTSAGGSSTFTAYADGQIHAYRGTATGRAATFTATTSEVGYFDRLSTDGDIVQFAKDGTTVGSIGVNNSRPYLTNSINCGIRLANNTLVPTNESGANESAATDLGATDVKWKDLHLSGTINKTVGSGTFAIETSGSSSVNLNASNSMKFTVGDSDSHQFINGTTQAMTLDASGNLLVGQSSSTAPASGNVIGAAISPLGYISTNRTSVSAEFGTQGDGDIVVFRKDGSSVGSIGTESGSGFDAMYVANGDTGLIFQGYANDAIIPFTASNLDKRDAAIDLGYSAGRFKDLYLSGTANAANFNTTSDATLKTNVETLTGSLDAVKSLRGVSFDWIENGGSEVGVIAQEVEAVLPDVVSTNDQGIKSVKYGNMVALLIEAMKEQQLRIEALEAQLNS